MIIPIKLDGGEEERFRRFAELRNQTILEMILDVVKEKINDESDWNVFKEMLAHYQIDQVTFTLRQIKREIGLR